MFGEYIPSNQGTVHDIYGNVQASSVDGRSRYMVEGQGTVKSIPFGNNQSVQVAAVDGQSPYIVARNNPMLSGAIYAEDGTKYEVSDKAMIQVNKLMTDSLLAQRKILDAEHSKTKMFLYGSLALNIGLIAYCAMKK
jgi:hypothetical protein